MDTLSQLCTRCGINERKAMPGQVRPRVGYAWRWDYNYSRKGATSCSSTCHARTNDNPKCSLPSPAYSCTTRYAPGAEANGDVRLLQITGPTTCMVSQGQGGGAVDRGGAIRTLRHVRNGSLLSVCSCYLL